MALVKLESVGALIDPEQGLCWPMNADGSPDEECMTDVRELDEESWVAALSPADEAIYRAALARHSA